jgi:Rieske [2Fe-2S] domain
MDAPTTDFVRAGSVEELKAKGRLVVHGPHRPILVVHDKDRVFAFDNRCPHMGFPLDRGAVMVQLTQSGQWATQFAALHNAPPRACKYTTRKQGITDVLVLVIVETAECRLVKSGTYCCCYNTSQLF